MGKRITEQDRLLNFAMNASKEGLDTAISTLIAIRRNKYPDVAPKTATKRAPRKRTPKVEDGKVPDPPPANLAAVASGD